MRLEIELTREEAALVMAAIERGEFEKFGKLTAKWRERARTMPGAVTEQRKPASSIEQIAQERRPARRAGGLKSRKWWKTEQGSLT